MNSFRLGELIKIKNGTKYNHLKEGDIPVYGSGGVMCYVNEYLHDGEVILLPRKGTLNNILYHNGKLWTVDTMYFAIVEKGTSPYYLYSYLSLLDLAHLDSGSALPSMTKSTYSDLEIKLPRFNEQKKIAKVLSDLDAKIEINNKINKELEAMAKLMYDYWFVQFDFPISKEQAEAMGKPDLEGKPYKSSGGKMVYSKELKREIPEGWEPKKLTEVTDLISRGITPNYLDSGGVCVLNQKCIRDHTVQFEFSRRHNKQLKKGGSKKLKIYDVLINSTGVGTLGRVAMLQRLKEDFITVDSHITIVRADNASINKLYLGRTLIRMQDWIERFSQGSTGQVELNKYLLEDISIVAPPRQLQDKYAKTFETWINKKANCEEENESLLQLRDWLLPMLMNGQVKVGEAEEELSKAADSGIDYEAGEKARILPILSPKEDKHFPKRKMLACYIINQSLLDPNFGDTKFEKLLHLSDYWAIQRNFQQRYYQKAAGPYDNAFTRQFFQQVLKAKWYKKIPYGNMNRIVAGEKQEKSTNTYGFFTEEELAKVDQLITYFRKYTYEQPEIISTLYAVWNNRLILGQEISDSFLKQDFLDWDEKKKKYKDRLDGALQWMRDEGLVPDGWGKLIEKPKGH